MKYDFGLSVQIDLIVCDSNPDKIIDLFVDFLNDLDDVKGFSLSLKCCESLVSLCNKEY